MAFYILIKCASGIDQGVWVPILFHFILFLFIKWIMWKSWLLGTDIEYIHDYVIKWKHFPRYWPLWVRGIQWIVITKASDAELWCFLWCAPEQTLEQTIDMPVIWAAGFKTPSRSLWRHCNVSNQCPTPLLYTDQPRTHTIMSWSRNAFRIAGPLWLPLTKCL